MIQNQKFQCRKIKSDLEWNGDLAQVKDHCFTWTPFLDHSNFILIFSYITFILHYSGELLREVGDRSFTLPTLDGFVRLAFTTALVYKSFSFCLDKHKNLALFYNLLFRKIDFYALTFMEYFKTQIFRYLDTFFR